MREHELTEEHHADDRHQQRCLVCLLMVGLVLPTLVTWIYFEALDDAAPIVQQTAYGIGKTVQFALPLLALSVVRSKTMQPGIGQSPRFGLSAALGLLSGLVIAAAIVGLYFYVLVPAGWMDEPGALARDKLKSMGLSSTAMLLSAAVFYSVIHSALEEYYWRWFVFGWFTRLTSGPRAVGISSFGFMAHHVIVLARYFGWDSAFTFLFAAAIAVGGCVWAEIYRRSGSLLGPWISHALVDASIFVIAYQLTFVRTAS